MRVTLFQSSLLITYPVVAAPTAPCTKHTSLFFFFQAEDGIRAWSVTGVQTCALPIYVEPQFVGAEREVAEGRAHERERQAVLRSEERRVGKECRSRWSAYD